MANSSSANIHVCPWSDHQIVTSHISHIGLSPTAATWCLNDSLLTDLSLVTQISDHLTEYFTLNDVDEISPVTLWAAHKAVMRGHLIEIASTRKRQKLKEIRSLTLKFEKTVPSECLNTIYGSIDSNKCEEGCFRYLILRTNRKISAMV